MSLQILDQILKNGKGLLLAYDHGFEHGPTDFDERSVDPAWVMEIANSGFFTGVICQKGIAAKYYNTDKDRENKKAPLIVKLNGKTAFQEDKEPISLQNCSVDEAIELGAVGVGYTIYVGSKHEEQMIQEFSKIEEEAHKKGLAVIGWMYLRGECVDKDTDKEAYAARLGLELNCDGVKVKYTGDVESFKKVVAAAGKTKVFVAGGPKLDIDKDTDTETGIYQMAKEVIEAGAAGLAVGRNIWQAKEPIEVAKKLAEIIYT